MTSPMETGSVSMEQLSRWADECHRINHLHTLLQRELETGSLDRAGELSERARRRAWEMLNEMFAAGIPKPADYCEPDPKP